MLFVDDYYFWIMAELRVGCLLMIMLGKDLQLDAMVLCDFFRTFCEFKSHTVVWQINILNFHSLPILRTKQRHNCSSIMV